MYRATPHSAIGVSPHAAMHGGREIRTVFPLIAPIDHVVDHTQDLDYKANMVNGQLPHTICIGDIVIVKQKKVNKLTPAFNPVPLRITQIEGSTVTAQAIDGLWSITRDASNFHQNFVISLIYWLNWQILVAIFNESHRQRWDHY